MKKGRKLRSFLPASWRFRLDLRDIRKEEQAHTEQAPPNTLQSERDGLLYEHQRNSLDLFQQRRELITKNFWRNADQLGVPMPARDEDGMWERIENDFTGRTSTTLTTAGERAMISAIREAEKHRREAKAFWLTWMTGLGGILIGVISVWPK